MGFKGLWGMYIKKGAHYTHQGSCNSLKNADFVVVLESMRLSIIVTMNSERLAAPR